MSKFNQFNYSRRVSDAIQIGSVLLGGSNPVRVQSMGNTDTNDVEGSVAQCLRIVEAGGDIVRFTTQGIREAENIGKIHAGLREKGCNVPLVADIHFNANAADVAATQVEKVRINPGNYVGSIKIGDTSDYTEEEFETEYQKVRARFIPFLNICKEHNTTIRLGVNHGSLSERMMNRYGDTSRGMVESCMEFLHICREENFHNVVISMKTSNTVMMVQTVRLLVSEMDKLGFHYPLHLGVTEAGDGEDGRIKSAVGIGALLADGIGDTVRVSLSEEPEFEVPVGKLLVSYTSQRAGHEPIVATENLLHNRFEYSSRKTHAVGNIGGENVPVVIATGDGGFATIPDYILSDGKVLGVNGISYSVYTVENIDAIQHDSAEIKFLKLKYADLTPKVLALLIEKRDIVVILYTENLNIVGEQRAFFHGLLNAGATVPVILYRGYNETELQYLQIKAAADSGVMFVDGFGDGILLENNGPISIEAVNSVAFGILQASRVRITKTEFISCPSCGRTMFKLQTVVARIKARTSHLIGLKIGIMGCIVNGPGEMADADYGYVGAGRGKVSLYKKKECLERSIPEDEAVEKLIDLIKVNGDWHE
ncbi:MAG: (E)-4-hydroxy-3-methylbut-2-enyl-diphosphate synthase [Paludibacter sp.]|nr:(E)-4-hydroxy-3-methylbut-2-enyl-diphosphate synthase [Paludibacter sp.]